jgi:hypothetical protein
MTVFNDDFESGNFNSWSTSGSTAIVTSPVHLGTYAAQATGVSYWTRNLGSSYSDLFLAAYVRMPSMLANNQTTFFMNLQDSGYTYIVAGGLEIDSGNAYWCLRVNGNWFTLPATRAS